MNYLRAITTEDSIWGEGVFVRGAMVDDNVLDSFLEWQKDHDKAIQWVPEDFDGRSQYYIHNIKSFYRQEWIFENKWKLTNRRK